MLPRNQRLTRTRDIKQVLRRGTCLRLPLVSVYLLARPIPLTARAACLVTKRIHRSSVRRHRYQRWLRAAVKDILPHLDQPYDIVLKATPAITQLTHSRPLREQLISYFSQQRGV